MTRFTLDLSFTAAVLAIVLATIAGIISAVFPTGPNPWVPPLVAGIVALAALIKQRGGVQD